MNRSPLDSSASQPTGANAFKPSEVDEAIRDEPTQAPLARSLLLKVAYDGANYFGWQRQPDKISVQEVLEKALRVATGQQDARAFASSRTDTGVHALAQAVLFRSTSWPASPDNLVYALNTRLPRDVVVRECVEVDSQFHPLRRSTGKRYRYFIYNSRKADPIGARTHWWICQRLNLAAMQAATEHFVGTHDFYSFQSTGSPRENTVRTVRSLTVTTHEHMDGTMYQVDVEANGFLYNMVRNIVGTLVQVGVGRQQPEWISDVLAAHDRRVAGAAAPPQGLFLVEVLF